MNRNLTPMGYGRIFRDQTTGAMIVDGDSIGRSGFAGEDDEPSEADYSQPSYQGEDEDDNGFGAGLQRYPARRQPQAQPRATYAAAQTRQAVDTRRDGVPDGWISTFLTGSVTIDAAGQATVTIRSQHPFMATDVTFEGSAPGAKVTQIMFGSRPVVNATDGIPTSVFTPTSQMRKHLEGQKLKAGLDIVVTGTLTGAGTLSAVFFGYKPPEG